MTRDMENLMPIGDFASASRLSHKALRLYGENGVLPPAWVDPEGRRVRIYLNAPDEQLRMEIAVPMR